MSKRHGPPPDASDEQDDASATPGGVRMDKWLWAARFFKTRAIAVEAIDAGKVSVNGDRVKRSRTVRVGDELQIRMGPYLHVVVVRGLSERRGGASDAAKLYEETEASRKAREVMAAHVKAMHLSTPHGAGRPTKKDRREIEQFKRGRDR